MTVPIDLVLLRAALPDLTLQPGTFLTARVVDRTTILLAGARMTAQLPEGVGEGDVLRLRVQEATSERLVMKVVERPDPQAQQVAPPAVFGLPLPGPAAARVLVDPEDEAERSARTEPRRSVTLRYDSPRLGRI